MEVVKPVAYERVEPRLVPVRGRYAFVCPTCRKRFEYDEQTQPICTGPSESRDDHEPTGMVRVHVDDDHAFVAPELAIILPGIPI